MDAIFVKSVLTERIKLQPMHLHAGYADKILQLLCLKVEDRCTKHGFIKKGSVEILKICMGALEVQTLKGDTVFNVRFRADVCNPANHSVLQATVQNINSFGILCHCGLNDENKPILEIIVPKQSVSIKSEVALKNIKIGAVVHVEVLGKKYELNDKKISVMGRIVKGGKRATDPNIETIQANEMLEEDGDDVLPDIEDAEEDADAEADTDAEGDAEEGGEDEVGKGDDEERVIEDDDAINSDEEKEDDEDAVSEQDGGEFSEIDEAASVEEFTFDD